MLALALALAAASPAHAETTPALTGLGTATGAALFAVPGAIGGYAAWTAIDRPDQDECGMADDHCMPGGAARGLFIGVPLGVAFAEVGAGTLTHHFLSGRGDRTVALSGALAAGGGLAIMGAGWAVGASGQDSETAALLVMTGYAGTIVAPPIAMGIVSRGQAKAPAVSQPVALRDVGFLAVEGGGGLRIGGSW